MATIAHPTRKSKDTPEDLPNPAKTLENHPAGVIATCDDGSQWRLVAPTWVKVRKVERKAKDDDGTQAAEHRAKTTKA